MKTSSKHRGMRLALFVVVLLVLLPAGNYVYQSTRVAHAAVKADLAGKEGVATLGYQILLIRYPLSPLAPAARLRLEAAPQQENPEESRIIDLGIEHALPTTLPIYAAARKLPGSIDQFAPIGFVAVSLLMVVSAIARRLAGARGNTSLARAIVLPGLFAGCAFLTCLVWLQHPAVAGIWSDLPEELLVSKAGSILTSLWGLAAALSILICLFRLPRSFVATAAIPDSPPPVQAAA